MRMRSSSCRSGRILMSSSDIGRKEWRGDICMTEQRYGNVLILRITITGRRGQATKVLQLCSRVCSWSGMEGGVER